MVLVRIQLLGPVRAWRDGDEIDLGGGGQRAVLALLAAGSAAGRLVSGSELVDALWQEGPPPSAANVIQTYLKRLRRLLEPDRPPRAPGGMLRREAGGYRLDLSNIDLDLVRFRRQVAAAVDADRTGDRRRAGDLLGEALRLWQGPPLANTPLGEPPVAVALSGERWEAVALFGEAMLATGNAAGAVSILEDAVAACPLDEAAQARLVRAHHKLGQRGRAFAVYLSARRRLADELGVDPGPELAAAYDAMLAEDRAHETRHGEPVASAWVPAQLPIAIESFTGRDDQLRQLDKLLSAGERAQAVVISGIAGTAGIGKTTLALHWAHQVADRFPDGQLFVNMRGYHSSGAQMSPSEAIRVLLDGLAVPAQHIPAGLDAQVGLYRSRMAGRRMLVVLDNARDPEQVRPLLPSSPGCLVLITSRNRLTGLAAAEGATLVRLDLLSGVEAQLLLRRRLGGDRLAAEPEAVEVIIERCAGLPLALALVSARAAVDAQLSLTSIAGELGAGLDAFAGGDSGTDARAVFSWSYQALESAVARMFRLLGVHPGPDVTVSAAASLAGVVVREARRLLAELVHASLLTEHVPGRFALHDLLRAYAAELADAVDSDEERGDAQRRMLDHYLHTARAAAGLLYPYRDPITLDAPEAGAIPEELADYQQALQWFTGERPVLQAIVRSAHEAGYDRRTWQFVWAVSIFLQRRGHNHDLADLWSIALSAAERLADRGWQARAHRAIADMCSHDGRLDETHAHLQRAFDLSRGLADRAGTAHTHLALGRLFEKRGDYRTALEHARQAIHLYEAVGHRTGQAKALNAFGWYHAHLGDHHTAILICRQALTLLEEIGDRQSQGLTWDSLGYAHHHLGDFQRAIACYQQALALLRDIGDRYFEAEALTHLGDTHAATGNLDEARAVWRTSLSILDDLGHPDAGQVRDRLRST